jgi:dihydrofolate reductase
MNIVVATCKNRGIGIKNQLPWRLLSDLYFFKYLTIGNEKNAVIMGKNTYLSLPKPLKYRDNIVLSTSMKAKKYNVFPTTSMGHVIPHLFKYDNVYLIGGETLYNEYIDSNHVKGIYHTHIEEDYECDTFFPEIPEKFNKIKTTKFKDIEKKTGKEVVFDVNLYVNSEYNGDCTHDKLINNFNITLKKMRVYHNIYGYDPLDS